MALYTQIVLASNLSELVTLMHAQHEAMRGHERGTTEPTIKVRGQFYIKSDYAWAGGAADAVEFYNGTAFILFADPRYAQLNAGGTVAMAANLPAGGYKITGLAAGTAAGDSVRYQQAMLVSGVNPMAADLAMGGFKITGLADPVAGDDAATKDYVDGATEDWGNFSYAGSGAAAEVVALGYQPSRVLVYFNTVGAVVVHFAAAVGSEDIVTVTTPTGTFQSRLKRTATGFEYRTANGAGSVASGPAVAVIWQAFR